LRENPRARAAVVTGAASGIGFATAQALLEHGVSVSAWDVDAALLQRRALEWHQAGYDAHVSQVDVTDATSVDAAFDHLTERSARLDFLVNVAGIVRYGRVEDFPESDWDSVMNVNVKSVFLACRRAIPLMRASGGGSIVNFASVQAVASQQTVAAYSASKGAVVSLTRTLALDHAADGIRVNCVLPGSVETPMLRAGAETFAPENPEAAMQAWGRQHPLGFLAQPEDMAAIVRFLLSEEARVITGASIVADEGLLAKLGV
jgi:NAD(P)-dependent dehydrogenase (short-subunit alcohol dehydrogenase family)